MFPIHCHSVLPSPRFSRAIGLVLDLFSGEKIAVAGCGFLGFFLCTCRYFWASFKSGGFTSCVTLRAVLFYFEILCVGSILLIVF